jgi:hypothetical protein
VEDTNGVRIDERSGKLVIAPRELVAELTDRVVGAVRKAQGNTTVKNYLAEVGPRFEKLTGKKPTGIPIWIPVSMVARDKLLGKVSVEFGFFVNVPTEGVQSKLGKSP